MATFEYVLRFEADNYADAVTRAGRGVYLADNLVPLEFSVRRVSNNEFVTFADPPTETNPVVAQRIWEEGAKSGG